MAVQQCGAGLYVAKEKEGKKLADEDRQGLRSLAAPF